MTQMTEFPAAELETRYPPEAILAPLPSDISQKDFDAMPWPRRLYWCPGVEPSLHAVIAAILDVAPRTMPRQYLGKAIVTSDSFLQCSFRDGTERVHTSAFIGSLDGIVDSMERLADFLGLKPLERVSLSNAIKDWVSIDYSGATTGSRSIIRIN